MTDSGQPRRGLARFHESGVEEGDTLDVEYLRDGNVGTVEVEPRSRGKGSRVFAWFGDVPERVPNVHRSARDRREFRIQ